MTHKEDKEAKRLRMQAYRTKLKSEQQGTLVETSTSSQPHIDPNSVAKSMLAQSTEVTELATQTVIPSADGGPGASPVKLEKLSEA